MFRIFFVCLISFQLSAQEWQLSYSGAPGDVQEKWLSGLPGSLWKIDFAAYTITDTLEFITYNGSVKFAAGSAKMNFTYPIYFPQTMMELMTNFLFVTL